MRAKGVRKNRTIDNKSWLNETDKRPRLPGVVFHQPFPDTNYESVSEAGEVWGNLKYKSCFEPQETVVWAESVQGPSQFISDGNFIRKKGTCLNSSLFLHACPLASFLSMWPGWSCSQEAEMSCSLQRRPRIGENNNVCEASTGHVCSISNKDLWIGTFLQQHFAIFVHRTIRLVDFDLSRSKFDG